MNKFECTRCGELHHDRLYKMCPTCRQAVRDYIGSYGHAYMSKDVSDRMKALVKAEHVRAINFVDSVVTTVLEDKELLAMVLKKARAIPVSTRSGEVEYRVSFNKDSDEHMKSLRALCQISDHKTSKVYSGLRAMGFSIHYSLAKRLVEEQKAAKQLLADALRELVDDASSTNVH